jgi:hypothetical protein
LTKSKLTLNASSKVSRIQVQYFCGLALEKSSN